MADALDPKELFGHVEDAPGFHVPRFLAPEGSHGHVHLPQPFQLDESLIEVNTGVDLIDRSIQPFDLMITKFMVLELVIAIIIAVCFIGLAKSLKAEDVSGIFLRSSCCLFVTMSHGPALVNMMPIDLCRFYGPCFCLCLAAT